MKTNLLNKFESVALTQNQQLNCRGGNADAEQAKTDAKKSEDTAATDTEYIILLVVIA